MKINWCKILGHSWLPVYIKAKYNGVIVRFIACYCDRCGKGRDQAHDINNVGIDREYGTYSESYFT